MSRMVVHFKRDRHDVYIGRGGPFGNPFKINEHGDRAAVIQKFEEYARKRIAEDPEFRIKVKALKGKVLGCWCAPNACHGDVLVKLTEELNAT